MIFYCLCWTFKYITVAFICWDKSIITLANKFHICFIKIRKDHIINFPCIGQKANILQSLTSLQETLSLLYLKKKSNEKWGPPKNRLEIIKKMIKPLNITQKVTVVTHYHFKNWSINTIFFQGELKIVYIPEWYSNGIINNYFQNLYHAKALTRTMNK